MNAVEKAAQAAVPAEGSHLRPLERVSSGGAPVLAAFWLGYTALILTAYAAGNMVTDVVGNESEVEDTGPSLAGKSGSQLLSMRQDALRR